MNRAQRRKEERLKKKTTTGEIYDVPYHLHRPWADILYETKLPSVVLDSMISLSDEVLSNPKRISWGNHLAGQIKDEPLIPPAALENTGLLDFFGNMITEYVHQCNLQKAPTNDNSYAESIKKDISVTIESMWIIEQQPGEYNPLHIHTNCDISTVMYLKVPTFLDSEKPERGDDGAIYFIGDCGAPNSLKMGSVKIKPSPGSFFIFPSHMLHTVYPYKTNDNFARRSVSFNAAIE